MGGRTWGAQGKRGRQRRGAVVRTLPCAALHPPRARSHRRTGAHPGWCSASAWHAAAPSRAARTAAASSACHGCRTLRHVACAVRRAVCATPKARQHAPGPQHARVQQCRRGPAATAAALPACKRAPPRPPGTGTPSASYTALFLANCARSMKLKMMVSSWRMSELRMLARLSAGDKSACCIEVALVWVRRWACGCCSARSSMLGPQQAVLEGHGADGSGSRAAAAGGSHVCVTCAKARTRATACRRPAAAGWGAVPATVSCTLDLAPAAGGEADECGASKGGTARRRGSDGAAVRHPLTAGLRSR